MPPDPKTIVWDTPHPDQIAWDGSSKAPSWGGAAARALPSAAGEIGGAISGAGRFLASLPDDPLGYKIGRALKAAPGAIADDLGGMAQYVRNLSAPQYQGTAPNLGDGAPQSHPWLSLAQGNTDPMKQAVAERPLALAGDVASVAGLSAPGRAALGWGSDMAMAAPRALGRAMADMTPERRAQNALLKAGGENPQALAAALEQNRSAVPGVSYSAAQASQDPAIAQLEKGSRINRDQGPAWAQFDNGQNTGMFNALHGVVSPATDDALEAARTARDAATKYDRQAALALVNQGSLEAGAGREGANHFAHEIWNDVNTEMEGKRGVLPAVQTVGKWVNASIPATSDPAGAAYEVRKRLADALNKRSGIDLGDLDSSIKSADVSSRAIKGSIDTALDDASGGMWRQYLDSFAANSKGVNSTQALNNIRADLEKKIEGGAVDGNGNPKLSRAYIKQVVERHSTNKFGDAIEPTAQARLDDILSTAQQLEAPQANYRMAATGGGGSDTASNLALAGANHLARALGPVGRIGAAVIPTLGERGGATQLAALLQNPPAAANAIRTAAARDAARRVRSNGITPAALALALQANQSQ